MNKTIELGRGLGFTEILHTNVKGEGQHVIATAVDTEAVRNEMQPRLQLLADESSNLKDMYPVREIPQYVMDRAFREGKFNDKEWWKRWANSEEGRMCGIERKGRIPRV